VKARLLAAAVGNCLSASALFCLRRAHVQVHGMRTSVVASLVRNDRARLRIGGLRVRITPQVDAADTGRIQRCLELFEDYCVVTQSVRAGLDVSVEVKTPAQAATEQRAPVSSHRLHTGSIPAARRGATIEGAREIE
jgi:uncharacterized OsmC-like protein